MSLPRRALCGAVDIKGWSGRPVPEQIRAQQSLVTVVNAACQEARLPEEIVQSSGDGVLIMPPSDIDETAAIPDLVRGMAMALRQENRLLAEGARIRLRLALTSGIVATGPAGFSGPAVIECFRLLDSAPARAALVDFPDAELAVIVSDYLYRDVIEHGFRDLRAEDFWNVRSSIPEKGFTANAWVWVSDRRGGVPPEATAPAGPAAEPPDLPDEIGKARSLADQGRPRDALALLDAVTPVGDAERLGLLDARADVLIALGLHQEAITALEEMLRTPAEPSPSALLRLGRAHLHLGKVQIARQTFQYMINHCTPLEPEVYVELGRLERLAGSHATAKGYLAEAARLLEPDGLLGALLDELLELPVTDH